MRHSKAFRPAVSDALESRLVLNGAGVSALTVYKAGLAPAIQNILGPGGTLPSRINNAFNTFSSYPTFTFASSGPAPYALLQGSVQHQIADASNQITNLLSPLKKPKNLVATVQNELVGTQAGSLATQVNTLLNQLATTANVSNDPNGLVPLVDPHAAALADFAVGHMMNIVYQAVENQVDLFLYAKGISNKPNKAFLASRFATYNSQLSAPFSTFTTKVQAAAAAYPSAPTPADTVTFTNEIFTQLAALSVSANGVFSANGASGPKLAALQGQVGGLGAGSVYQVTTSLAFDEYSPSVTYPAGFVSLVIADVSSVMQFDLASTGSA